MFDDVKERVMKSIEEAIKQTKQFRNKYHRASVNLIYTGKWIFNQHSHLFKQYGLSVQQYNVLRILSGRHQEVASLHYIKERMLDKMSDASRIVDTFVKKQLVIRNQSSTDRRKIELCLSPQGVGLLDRMKQLHTTMDAYLKNLSEVEVEQLNMLLNKARDMSP